MVHSRYLFILIIHTLWAHIYIIRAYTYYCDYCLSITDVIWILKCALRMLKYGHEYNIIQSYVCVPTYLGTSEGTRVFKQLFSFKDADQEHSVKFMCFFLDWHAWSVIKKCKYSTKIQIIGSHNLICVALMICSFVLDFRVRVSLHCIIIMSVIARDIGTTCSFLQFYSSSDMNELERKITSYRYLFNRYRHKMCNLYTSISLLLQNE